LPDDRDCPRIRGRASNSIARVDDAGPVEPSTLSWPEVPPRHGRVLLREFEPGDVDMVLDLATDPYVPLIGTLPAHADRDQAIAWIERQRQRLTEGAGFSFAIADRSTERALGSIGLWLSGWAHGRASVGYSVAPLARRAGVATDALKALVDFAWSIPELFRLEAYIEPFNTPSQRVVRQAGFAVEGLLRSHQTIGGTRRDMLLHSLVRSE
jgi:ribosomal-protein-alanine N-acetyltransferase